MPSLEGTLTWVPLTQARDEVAASVAAVADNFPSARVATIDPHLADTAEFCAAYDVDAAQTANCVVVAGRRGEVTTLVAVLVRASDKADINGIVRRHVGARKMSFADQEQTEIESGMVRGGITSLGLPQEWVVLIDEAVMNLPMVLVGAGVRGAKIIVDPKELAAMPQAEVISLAVPA